jgi:hypothetical protein
MAFFSCAEPVRQLGGESPLPSLTETKGLAKGKIAPEEPAVLLNEIASTQSPTNSISEESS